MNPLLFEIAALVILGVAASAGTFWLFIYGPLKGTRMGINTRPVQCPGCGRTMSPIRKPANLRQAMWGGYTCPACGTEMDKWGNKV